MVRCSRSRSDAAQLAEGADERGVFVNRVGGRRGGRSSGVPVDRCVAAACFAGADGDAVHGLVAGSDVVRLERLACRVVVAAALAGEVVAGEHSRPERSLGATVAIL